MDDNVQSTRSVPDMLERLLSNPELLKNVGELLNSPSQPTTASASETKEVGAEETPNARGAPTTPVFASDGLSKVLSDPDILQKLPRMMEILRPMIGEGGDGSVPTSAAQSISAPRVKNCRDDLLLALKPFLSPTRAEAVDMIIRLSRLGNVLGSLQ